ncbi:hypothetical protein LCGC14_1866950 [marine sediment metagenome]|uniref:LacI family transcriptional regulator n=1 Tax=marine sediment metagenome TaxID=412755 RepID=A0A0F9IK63_9ZZZZ
MSKPTSRRTFLGAAVAGTAGDAVLEGITLTHNRVKFGWMGQQAVDVLQQRCLSPKPTEPRIIRIESEFVIGHSTAPPAARA